MELTFIGRGAAFNAEAGNTNAYFIEDEKLFLIDCGEGMFSYLKRNHILAKVKEVYALISHTHSDHCGSLGSVGLYCQFVLQNKLKIIVPHDEVYNDSLRTLMRIFGNTEKAFELVYEEEIDGKFKAFDKVRYELTLHDYMLTSFSFIFETKEGDVFFSADTRVADNLLNFINTHKNINKMYMEVTDAKNKNDIHMNIYDLCEVIPQVYRNKIYMMHFRNENCMKIVQEAGFQIVKIDAE